MERRAQEWAEQDYRFEELGDYTSDEGEREDLALENVVGDRLQFTGFDMGSGRRHRRIEHDYAADYERENHYPQDERWQADMLTRQEDLLESALRRIRRAKAQGAQDVNLSRDELNALERSQMLPPGLAPRPLRPLPARVPSGSDRDAILRPDDRVRRSSGRRTASGGNTPTMKTPSPAKRGARMREPESAGASSGRRSNTSSPQGQRPSPRSVSGTYGQRTVPAGAAGFIDPRVYDQAVAMGYRSRPSSRSSSSAQRPPHDDPDLHYMSRSQNSSSTHLPIDQLRAAGRMSPGRRNVSGPAAMSYADDPRRPSPLPNSAAIRRVPVGRTRPSADESSRPRAASTLKKEIIEISSDSDEEPGEDDDGDEQNIEDDEEYVEEPQVRSRFARTTARDDDDMGRRSTRNRRS